MGHIIGKSRSGLINRGHHDEVRATTNVDLLRKTQYRLASIDRVWKSDKKFLERNAQKLHTVEGKTLLLLAKIYLLDSQIAQAREALFKWNNLQLKEGRAQALIIKALTFIPCSGKLLTRIRNILH